MSGRWRIKKGAYVPTAHQAKTLLKLFTRTRLTWIPRRINATADELSKAGLGRRGVHVTKR